MTTSPAPLAHLWRVMQGFIAAHPALAAFDEGALAGQLPYVAAAPSSLPVVEELAEALDYDATGTRAVVTAILQAAPVLRWQQSYAAAEVGEDFLAHYGWFNLVSPDGPFVHAARRLSVGYWGQGLHYPRHWHRPAEIYAVLAGEALCIADGRQDIRLGPMGTTTHPPDLPHAAVMDRAPLLALGLWKGEGLMAKPTLPQPQAEARSA